MPTYEYECDSCEHRFEEFQSFSDPKLTTCPACGKESLRRLFGAGAAILFKGPGFYETDYRSESYKSAAKADQDAGAKSDSSGKSESSGNAGSNGSAGGSAKPAAAGET